MGTQASWRALQHWLNRIGQTLQFIALFLVTPDIIGKERMTVTLGATSRRLAQQAKVALGVYVGVWRFC